MTRILSRSGLLRTKTSSKDVAEGVFSPNMFADTKTIDWVMLGGWRIFSPFFI